MRTYVYPINEAGFGQIQELDLAAGDFTLIRDQDGVGFEAGLVKGGRGEPLGWMFLDIADVYLHMAGDEGEVNNTPITAHGVQLLSGDFVELGEGLAFKVYFDEDVELCPLCRLPLSSRTFECGSCRRRLCLRHADTHFEICEACVSRARGRRRAVGKHVLRAVEGRLVASRRSDPPRDLADRKTSPGLPWESRQQEEVGPALADSVPQVAEEEPVPEPTPEPALSSHAGQRTPPAPAPDIPQDLNLQSALKKMRDTPPQKAERKGPSFVIADRPRPGGPVHQQRMRELPAKDPVAKRIEKTRSKRRAQLDHSREIWCPACREESSGGFFVCPTCRRGLCLKHLDKVQQMCDHCVKRLEAKVLEAAKKRGLSEEDVRCHRCSTVIYGKDHFTCLVCSQRLCVEHYFQGEICDMCYGRGATARQKRDEGPTYEREEEIPKKLIGCDRCVELIMTGKIQCRHECPMCATIGGSKSVKCTFCGRFL